VLRIELDTAGTDELQALRQDKALTPAERDWVEDGSALGGWMEGEGERRQGHPVVQRPHLW